jgi:metallo-beta-lactamase family protein
LYTEEQARRSLGALRPVPFDRTLEVHDSVRVRFYPAGHILGASIVEVRLKKSDGGETVLVFSGDLGRPHQPIIPEVSPLPPCDHLVLESTYGLRDHPTEDPKDRLESLVRDTVEEGGTLLIPAFAVGRTQALLYLLRELQQENRLPVDIPVYVDSPMAIHTIRVFMQHREAHDREMRARVALGGDPLGLRTVHLLPSVVESKALNSLRYPAIIISASGMAVGGRVLHHLRYRLPDHRTTVLFVGFQAAGTRGRALQDGAEVVKIHGREVRVRARVETLDGLSAHADRAEILAWLRAARTAPGEIHLVHGEPDASEALADRIEEQTGTRPHIPCHLEKVRL